MCRAVSMKIILVIGLLTLSQCLHGQIIHDFSASSTYSESALKFLCKIFPNFLKSKCKSDQSLVENNLEVKDSFSHHAMLQVDSNENVPIASRSKSTNKYCEFCKSTVKRYQPIINKTLSPEYVQKRFLNVCETYKLPFKDRCIRFFKGPGFEMIKAILKSEDPAKVCQIIKICPKSDTADEILEILDLHVQDLAESAYASRACKQCIKYIKWYEKNINRSKTAIEVQASFIGICHLMNEHWQKICVYYFNSIGFEAIKGILTKKCPKKVCQTLYYCRRKTLTEELLIDSSAVKDVPIASLSKSTNKYCEFCKSIVKRYQPIINKTLTPECVQKRFLNVCETYKLPFKDRCIRFFKGPGFEMIKAILKSEDPAKVCQIIKICPKSDTTDEILEFLDLHVQDLAESAYASRACKKCIKYIEWYEKNINRSKTAIEVQASFIGICHLMDEHWQKICVSYFKSIGFEAIKGILTKKCPKKVCQTLHYCRRKTLTEELLIDSSVVKESSAVSSSDNPKDVCRYCKLIVKKYEQIINKSVTPEFIQNIIFELCKLFKSPVKDQCLEFYKGKGFKVIKAILKSENPKKVCQIVDICKKFEDSSVFLGLFEVIFQNAISNIGTSKACKACMIYIKWYEDNIDASITDVEIQKRSLRSCEILNAHEKNFCQIFYNTIGFEIIQGILKKEDPKKVCQIITYCYRQITDIESPDLPDVNKDVSIAQDNPKEACRLCKSVVKKYEMMINKSLSPETVQKQFINVCGIFGSSIKEQCIKFLNGPGFEIIKAILKSADPKKVCQIIKLCTELENYREYLDVFNLNFETEYLNKKTGKACKICIKVIQWYEKEIDASKKAVEIQKVFIEFCHIFKHHHKNFCIFFYSTLGMDVIEGILKKEDPKKICRIMYYCRRATSELLGNEGIKQFNGNDLICKKIENILNEFKGNQATEDSMKTVGKWCDEVNYFPYECNELNTEILRMSFEYLLKRCPGRSMVKVGSDESVLTSSDSINPCRLCKEVVFIVHRLSLPTKTEASINEAFNKACLYLPLSNEKECLEFVKKYRQTIIKLFLKGESWASMCQKLKICEENLSNSMESILEDVNPTAVKEPVLQKVKSLCSILSVPLIESCVQIISVKSREEIENILKTQDPHGLYEVIEAHYKEKLESFKKSIFSKEHVENPIECLLCKEIMKELEKILARNPSKEKIKKALGKVCNVFHGKMKRKCQSFVNKFSDKIVDLLLQKYTPKMLCKLLLLCSDILTDEDVKIIDILLNRKETNDDSRDKKEIKNIKQIEKEKDDADPAKCVICTKVLEEIIKLIGNKKSKEEIEKAMDMVCHLLPEHMKEKCEYFVHEYGDRIIEFILNHMVASKICSVLRLCATNDDTLYFLPKVQYL